METDKIELLKAEIVKRDKLIYAMMRNHTHLYQHFMMEESDDILDKLINLECKGEMMEHRLALKKIDQLHKVLFSKL